MGGLAALVLGAAFLAFLIPSFSKDPEDDGPDPIEGTPQGDTLSGTDEFDIILGFAGNDSLSGDAGDDSLDGDLGNDSLFGEDGDDTLIGGIGGDYLDGGAGDDLLEGGEGRNRLEGGPGNDTLSSIGADQMTGSSGNDVFRLDNDVGDVPYPTITDFTPLEDKLEFYYTPVEGVPPPEVVLSPDDGVFGQNSYLEADGRIIAYVLGEFGMAPGDIVLIPKT